MESYNIISLTPTVDEDRLHFDDASNKEEEDVPMEVNENNEQGLSEADDSEVEGKEVSKIVVQQLYGAKLIELVRGLCSEETKLCTEASKEFIKLLRSDSGGKLLHEYVVSSPSCTELMQAWNLRQGKSGMPHVLYLVGEILDHPDGKYKCGDLGRMAISKNLDKFARLIFETKLNDVYTELNSREGRHQDAALLLMAAIVRRGVGLASEVAKTFDFKLPVFTKLAQYQKGKSAKKIKYSTRHSFIEFAMSFLEIGNPRLLRWVLQKKEMYSGVLCGLGNDDDETIVFVLSTLRDRVLTPESLVPPGLRSVLFGSVTLEQLINISGNSSGGPSAEIAYDVLVMVCTDPHNGLMPDLKSGQVNSLKGNRKRLLDLMKKLNATEAGYHRELLLAIVNGRPSFGSAYLDEFPYVLEPRVSSSWYAAISLVTDLVISTRVSSSFASIFFESCDPLSTDSSEIQCILKCIVPRAFGRIVINRGLLHSDVFVRHGSIRFLLEALKSFDSLLGVLSCISHMLDSLKQEIQDEIRALLPDPQVLYKLLSSTNFSDSKIPKVSLKRQRDPEKLSKAVRKERKLKSDVAEEDDDILISGVNMESVNVFKDSGKEELDIGKDYLEVISGIWGLKRCTVIGTELRDADIYFHSKLLDVLTLYLRTLPTVVEGSFDFFEILPEDPFTLAISQQQSLLSLLTEYIGGSPGVQVSSIRPPELMYKHLRPLLNLLIYSPDKVIQDQAYILSRAAILSSGGFDMNLLEIDAWLLFLPGYRRDTSFVECQSVEAFRDSSAAVISFLCDVVSIVGNNLYKYLDILRCHIANLKDVQDNCPDCSPLVICILNKCLKMLDPKKEEPELHEKSMILAYVCNTLGFLLQTQVRGGLLSSLIQSIVTEKSSNSSSVEEDSRKILCEWRPLNNLFLFSKDICDQRTFSSLHLPAKKDSRESSGSFVKVLNKANKILKREWDEASVGESTSFCLLVLRSTADEIADNFPMVITISESLLGAHHTFLSYKVFSEQGLLGNVADLWPALFYSGLDRASKNDSSRKNNDDLMDSASAAFASFLEKLPFHILFSAIFSLENSELLSSTGILNFLKLKLSEGSNDDFIASLRLLLFWVRQIRFSYKLKPLDELKHLSASCFILINHLLAKCLMVKSYSLVPYISKIVETIVHSPAVIVSLSAPLRLSENLVSGSSESSLEELFSSLNWNIDPVDQGILQIFTRIGEYLLDVEHSSISDKKIVKSFKTVVEQIVLSFRNEFEVGIKNKDLTLLLPSFYILRAVSRFISPFALMELGHWMLCEAERNDSINFALSIGCYIVENAFELLQTNLMLPEFVFLWDLKEDFFGGTILVNIYQKVLGVAIEFNLKSADICLLKAINVVYKAKTGQPPTALLFSIMALSRVIGSTNFQIISHCICKPNATKAHLLFRLAEVSPPHLVLSGNIISCVSNKESKLIGSFLEEISSIGLTNDDLIMFMPIALSYLNLYLKRFGVRALKHFKDLSSFYSKILLEGFVNWNSYSSGYLFQEEYEESSQLPSSTRELLDLFGSSLLGKAVQMLRYHFIFQDSTEMKKRMNLFNSLYPHSGVNDDMFGCELSEISGCSPNDSLNIINKVIAKITLSKMLLAPKGTTVGGSSESEGHGKMRFINILVKNLHNIVKSFPLATDSSEKMKSREISVLFRQLEALILENIVELSKETEKYFTELPSLSFLEKFMKSSLLYRFEDPTTLKVLRRLLLILSKGKFSFRLVFELLLSHSHFMATILWNNSTSISSGVSHVGTLLRPISSIFKSNFLSIDKNVVDDKIIKEESSSYERKLQLIKLLRVVHALKACEEDGISYEKDASMNSRELLALLLSCYGATVSKVDVEVFDLMHEIVATDGFDFLAELDYLWGSAVLKLREEKELEKMVSSKDINNCQATDDNRRRHFRENLNLDPELVMTTILHFPYDRVPYTSSKSIQKPQEDEFMDTEKKKTANTETEQRYDPSFILRLSSHSLSMGYLEPLEFAGLGLLAIAFMSISSSDEGIRRQGYEVLGKFKTSLESSRYRKEGLRLRLLLTYLQNGIDKAWQRVPSVIAIFSAEASFVLLDPSNDRCLAITKLLTRSPRVNLKSVPLFDTMFESISVSFRTDRLWILRLSYSGLKLDDDDQFFLWQNILETLLKFYNSSLSDNESNLLILQIVKKAIQLPIIAKYLVEQCGLLLWLSSVLSFCCQRLHDDSNGHFVTQMMIVVEVINNVISLQSITEWLEKYAFEQLSEVSSHVFNLLLSRMTLTKQNGATLLNCLEILVSTLRMSQKRDLHQTCFTLSFKGLSDLYQVLEPRGPCVELGLTAILMSPPPRIISNLDKESMLKFVMQGMSTVYQLFNDMYISRDSDINTSLSMDQHYKESFVSKLLRWISASVILSRVSSLERKNSINLQSLIKRKLSAGKDDSYHGEDDFSKDRVLAATILYLQQFLGSNCRFLPSVVTALCFLLLNDGSINAGYNSLDGDQISMVELLYSRINCPPEVDPTWRWLFDQPWEDLSLEVTDLQKLDELHACESLMVIFTNSLNSNTTNSHALSHVDLESSGVFAEDRTIVNDIFL